MVKRISKKYIIANGPENDIKLNFFMVMFISLKLAEDIISILFVRIHFWFPRFSLIISCKEFHVCFGGISDRQQIIIYQGTIICRRVIHVSFVILHYNCWWSYWNIFNLFYLTVNYFMEQIWSWVAVWTSWDVSSGNVIFIFYKTLLN